MTLAQEAHYKESIIGLRKEWDELIQKKRDAEKLLLEVEGRLRTKQTELLGLTEQARQRQFRLDWYDEMESRVSTGGAIALSEFIVLKTEKTKTGQIDRESMTPIWEDRLWIKVIDVRKGYWAEAPFTRDVAIGLNLKLKHEQMILGKETKQE